MLDLGLCFGVNKCQICGHKFEEREAKYEIEGIGCVCWRCKRKLEEVDSDGD